MRGIGRGTIESRVATSALYPPRSKNASCDFGEDILVYYRFLPNQVQALLDFTTRGVSFVPLNDRWQLHLRACYRRCVDLGHGAQCLDAVQ